jgi:PTH1 family peptidyl-tRNA hydrolase
MPWVSALCEAVADNAAFLVTGQDASFANKVHLAMDAKGFTSKDDGGKS